MATVVIIHAPDDTLPARALAEKLRQAKLTVVLEKQGEELREATRSAQAAVALWSPRSAADPATVDDVSFVRGRSKLVHALMQNTPLPAAFNGDKAANLTGWRGEDDFPGWRELANLVTERAGVAPLPPPAPRVASGFFTPGRVDPEHMANAGESAPAQTAQRRPAAAPQPQRQAPAGPPPRAAAPPRPAPPRTAPPPREYAPEPAREKSGSGMMIVIIALIVLIAGGGGGYFWWSQQQSAQAASAAWDSIDHNDPGALRSFIATQSGAVKQRAQAALSQLEERSYEAASDADTVEALQTFVHDFPDSQHSLAARGRIAELQASAASGAPAVATTTDTTASTTVSPDLVPPSASAPATTGTAPPAASGGPAALTPPPSTPPPEQPSAPTTTP